MQRTCGSGLMVLLLVAGLGCASSRLQEAWQSAAAAMQDCQAQFVSGTLRSHVAAAECGNARARTILAEAKYPHMDLVDLLHAERLQLATQVDMGRLMPAEAQAKWQQVQVQVNELTRERERQAAERRAAILLGIGVALQRMGDGLRQAAPPTPTPTGFSCTTQSWDRGTQAWTICH